MTRSELKGRWVTEDRKYSILFSFTEEETDSLQFSAPNEVTKDYGFRLENGILIFDVSLIQLMTANARWIKLLYKGIDLTFFKNS